MTPTINDSSVSFKKFVADFIARLTSRKFMIAIGGIALIATGMLNTDQINQVVALIIAFITAEGVGDAADRFTANKATAAKAQLEETALQFSDLGTAGAVDRSTVVAGSDIPMQ